ncbi:phospholipase domain-containing protein [uncultured Sphingomonas sp.]|uniref:phospholipase domain-containing protein n=1 Tax=uncultured Sphingomonas sp. TaxID=158754 RepID=UPI0030FC1D7B
MAVAMDARYPVTGERRCAITVPPGDERHILWPVTASDHWYDLSVTRDGWSVRRAGGSRPRT